MKDELKRAVHHRGRTTEDSTKKTKTVEKRAAKRSVKHDMDEWPQQKCTNCKGYFVGEILHVLRLNDVGHVWCTKCLDEWRQHHGIEDELAPGSSYVFDRRPGYRARLVLS